MASPRKPWWRERTIIAVILTGAFTPVPSLTAALLSDEPRIDCIAYYDRVLRLHDQRPDLRPVLEHHQGEHEKDACGPIQAILPNARSTAR